MSREGASLAASILSSRVVLRAFSVWNASHFKPYGLPLHAKRPGGAVPPHRALPFSKEKCSKMPWLPVLPLLSQSVRRGKILPTGHAAQQIFPVFLRRRFGMRERGEQAA